MYNKKNGALVMKEILLSWVFVDLIGEIYTVQELSNKLRELVKSGRAATLVLHLERNNE